MHGGHPGTEIRGGAGLKKKKHFFFTLWASVWSKNKRGEREGLCAKIPPQ